VISPHGCGSPEAMKRAVGLTALGMAAVAGMHSHDDEKGVADVSEQDQYYATPPPQSYAFSGTLARAVVPGGRA
jgi:hypothetical protein